MTTRMRNLIVGATVVIVLIGIVTAGLLSSGLPQTPQNVKYFTVDVGLAGISPTKIEVTKGDTVTLYVGAMDLPYPFTFVIPEYGISVLTYDYGPIQFVADKAGTFAFYVQELPSVQGQLVVTE